MISKIKKRLFGFGLYSVACLSLFAQKGGRAATPVYLDENKAIEQRVEDALSRMTLEEKVAMVHAQSNFSSAGCPRLGIPELWMSDGPHGVRAEVLWGNFLYGISGSDLSGCFFQPGYGLCLWRGYRGGSTLS